jgi:hypothetical protein
MDVSTEIGALLRHWRERLTPAEIGLPTATGRRVPGLRRLEVRRNDVNLEELHRALVGDLRARHGRHPGDPTLARLIEELRTRQPKFHAMWEHGEVHAYRQEVKAFTHPDIGRLTLDCDIVALDGQQQHQAIIYTAAPHTRSAAQLRRLRTHLVDGADAAVDASA